MSLIDTDAIWLALGDFYDMFPDEERVYWNTFWESYSDIIADLWGFAFQVDRAKSLFSTTPTMERREVLVVLSGQNSEPEALFRISGLKQDASGRWILRGFVPRDSRNFRQLPDQGLIRIGVDVVAYDQVNYETIVGGAYDGYVREATFVLAEEPAHDYVDDPDFNDDFARQPQTLKFRIDQSAGSTTVDAVLLSPSQPVTVNDTGRLVLGVPGVNAEIVDYESVSIIADRYVFTLATSWQAPDTGAEALDHDHFLDEQLVVERYDPDRWSQAVSGRARVIGAGRAEMIIDQSPAPGAASAELQGSYHLAANVDFDVAVVVTLNTWPDPTALDSDKHAYARLRLGAQTYVVGFRSRRTAGGALELMTTSGPESSPTETTVSEAPDAFEARFKRVGSVLEFQYRPLDQDAFQVLELLPVTGEHASLDLVVSDPDTETDSRVFFDEVVRRAGDVVGNTRLEDFFSATSEFPHTYDIDQNLVSAPELLDRPRTRSESMTTSAEVTDAGALELTAVGGEDFQVQGLPEAGTLIISGRETVYDSVARDGDVFTFALRQPLDPDLIPLLAGTALTANTRTLDEGLGYEFTGASQVRFRDLPTRDRMWAPVAQVDIRHVQNTYGVLVDLDADVSTSGYLNRVQGTWFALMNGPSIRNVETGLQLAMGLPVARVSGTVTDIGTESDVLGRVTRRTLTVLGDSGAVVHDLNPDVYPDIDWVVGVGSAVDQFEPLTNGIEVLDAVEDNNWHLRFPGVADIERFNSFGVFVALEALSSEADVSDAIRFALRIKPTYTKMFMRFVLTSGDEDLSQDLDDDTFAIELPHLCEDVSFDEGPPPADPYETLRLGEGHKLGQGKRLGAAGHWRPETLGTYVRLLRATGDGSTTAGSDEFTSAGAYTFTATDVGRTIHVGGVNYKIAVFVSATTVRVMGSFPATATGLDWELRSYKTLGEGETLGALRYYRCLVEGSRLPSEILDAEEVVTVALSP